MTRTKEVYAGGKRYIATYDHNELVKMTPINTNNEEQQKKADSTAQGGVIHGKWSSSNAPNSDPRKFIPEDPIEYNERKLLDKTNSGTASARERAISRVMRKDRESKLSPNIADDYKKLIDEYNSFDKKVVTQNEFDKMRENSKKIRDNLQKYSEYFDIYGSDNETVKMFDEMTETANGINDEWSKFKTADEYRGVRVSSKINTYAELRQKRALLQRKRGNEGYNSDRIESELDALEKYGYNKNVVASMTEEDFKNEIERLKTAKENAGIRANKYNSYDYINAQYNDAVNVRGLSEEEAKKELQEQQKNAGREVEYYDGLLNEMTELERITKIERNVQKKWGDYKNAVSLGGVPVKKIGESGSKEYDVLNNSDDMYSDSPNGMLQRVADNSYVYSYATDEERNTYNYIHDTVSPEKASEFLEDITPLLNKRKSTTDSLNAYNFGKQHAIIGTAGSVLFNALPGALSSIVNNAENIISSVTGKEIDPYDPRFQGTKNAQMTQQGVKDTIDSNIGKIAYSAGTQAAELAITMGVSLGIGGAIGKAAGAFSKGANTAQIANKAANVANQVLLSSKSMLSTTLEYKENGESDLAAVGMGMLSGIIEAYTERNSLSNLLKSPDIFKDMAKGAKLGKWAKKIGIDALKEGLEEVEANALNTVAALAFDYRNNDTFLSAIDNAKRNGKTDSEALAEAIKAVAPEYIESFAVGALAGGIFSTANTASSVRSVNSVTDFSADYFSKNGTSRENVTKLLIDMGYTDDAQLYKATNAIMKKGNGKTVSAENEALFEDDVRLRGVLHGYVEVVDAESRRDTVSKVLDEVREKETTSTEVETTKTATVNPRKTFASSTELTEAGAEARQEGYRQIVEDNAEESFRTRGRSGSKILRAAMNNDELVEQLLNAGYSELEAEQKIKNLFSFMYNQGRINGNVDIAVKTASENILSGHEDVAREFFVAGQMDAQGRLIGKTNAMLVPNQTLKNMQKNGQINSVTVRAINSLASKLGINIRFSDMMRDGEAGYFNKATGTLMINANAKNKYFLTAVHESIHAIRTIHPESYNKLSDIVYEVLSGNESSFDKAWSKTLAIYKKEASKDGKLNRDLIDEELTAKVVSHLLTDESYIKELAKTNRNAVQRIYDAIVDLFEKIFKRYSEDATPSEAEFKDALKELQSDFNSIKAMYENALKETTNVQQSKIVLPKSGDGADVLNSKESLTDDLEDDNIKSSKGGQSYGQTTDNSRGVSGISEKSWDKRGRDSSGERGSFRPIRQVSVSENLEKQTELSPRYTPQDSARSSETSLDNNSESALGMGREGKSSSVDYDRRFAEALRKGNESLARALLDEQATKNGYVPVTRYRGEKSKSVKTSFKDKDIVWVSTTFDYAKEYARNGELTDGKMSEQLHTSKYSNVYDLYAKYGKVLELGDIEQTIESVDDLNEFANKIGFTTDEVIECMDDYRKVGTKYIYSITYTKKFADLARKNGYDSLHALEDNGKVETYGILYPENVKSSKLITYDKKGNVIPLSERFNSENEDIRYSLESGEEVVIESPIKRGRIVTSAEAEASYFELKKEVQKKLDEHIKKYGAIKKGEDAVRDAQFPAQTSDDRYVRRFTRTAFEADSVTDEVASQVAEEVANGSLWTTYTRVTDKRSVEIALNRFKSIGYEKMLEEWEGKIASNERIEKSDIAKAMVLVQEASKRGDMKTAMGLIAEIAAEGTRAGQLVQSLSLLKKLSGQANVYYIEKTIQKIQQDIDKKYSGKFSKKKHVVIKVPDDLLKKFKEVYDREKKSGSRDHSGSDKIIDDIMKNVAEQMPVTWSDKFNAVRYFHMLGNPRTHIRNIFGNIAFMPVVFAKNMVASVGEGTTAAAFKLFGKNMQRTKSIGGALSFGGEYVRYGKKDADKIEKMLRGENKYGELQTIMQNRKIFKSKMLGWLNKAIDLNSRALEAEDWLFLKHHYARALTMYMKSNKLSPDTITEKQLEAARMYAVNEAQKATFRDESALASMLSEMEKKNKALYFGISSIMPFKKTPINILKRGIEYSPAGILSTIGKGIKGVYDGKFSAVDFIDGMGSFLSGSGLCVLGVYLASQGMLRGPGDDDDENKLAMLNGMQNYAIKIGNGTYTIDWMSPAAMALFVGCEMWNASDDGEISFSDIYGALAHITEPLFDMSMLDGVTNILEAASYAQSAPEAAAIALMSIVTNYFGQYVSTLSGQIARTVDNTRRKTYVDKNSKVPEWLQVFAAQQAKKIPGLTRYLEPYVNAKGEEEQNAEGNIFARAIQNFLSPGYYKSIKSTEVDDEISRLHKMFGEDAKDIIPKIVDKKITVKGETVYLSDEQYTTYQKTTGQTYYSKLKEIISSDYYKELSDKDKVRLLKKVKEYSVEKGREETLSNYHSNSGWLMKAFETDGMYRHVLNDVKKGKFSEEDLVGDAREFYEEDKDRIFSEILDVYNPDNLGYELADKFYKDLYELSEKIALEENSDGQYVIEDSWIVNAKGLKPEERAQYIYGRAILTKYDDQEKANEALQNDSFISDNVRGYLLQKSFGGNDNPSRLYTNHLARYSNEISFDEYTRLWEKWEAAEKYKEGKKTIDKKDQILPEINKLKISDAAKSRIYDSFGWGNTENALKGLPWSYVPDSQSAEQLSNRIGQDISGKNSYTSKSSPYNKGNNGGAFGQCVWYVIARAQELLGKGSRIHGNGNEIYYNAPKKAQVEAKPDNLKGNMLVSYKQGSSTLGLKYGHVIYIEAVDGDTVYYTEGGSFKMAGILRTATRQEIMNGQTKDRKLGSNVIGFVDVTKY